MVMEVKLLLPEKAKTPMLVTLPGMIVFLQPTINVFVDVSIIALQFPLESYFAFPFSTDIEVKPLQPSKAFRSILVTLLEMVMEVKPLQPLKAQVSMFVTPLGMMMEVMPVFLEKAKPPMLVTLPGMMVFLQPTINVFVDVSIIALQFSLESYVTFPLSTDIEVKPLQPSKAC